MMDSTARNAATLPTLSSAWVAGVVRLFKSVGLDAASLFRDAGLDLAEVSNPDARFEADRISHLWELAVARSGDPNLGLATPDMAHPGSVDVIVHVMMTCPNLISAVDRLLRYMRIVSDVAELRLVRHGESYGLGMHLVGMEHPVPRARMDFMVVTLLNILRWLTGLNLRPESVELPYPEPVDPQAHRLAFRCPLRFDAPVYQLRFSAADMTAPLPTSNPALALLNDRIASEHLSRIAVPSIGPRVRHHIVRRLPDGDPSRADVAREIGLSERTLHRRLQEEGTTFNALVESSRQDLAEQYLRTSGVSLSQAAYMLGFADQSTFFRACKRWFGTSPGEYRARLAKRG